VDHNLIATATKRKDGQMGLHKTKKPLHNKRNGHQIEDAAHRMGENLCHTSDKGLTTRINRELKKLNSKKKKKNQ
jgi:hypothetical protein